MLQKEPDKLYLLSMTANAWRINVVVSAPCKVEGNRSQNLPQGSSSWGPAALPQKSRMLVWRMTSCAPLTSLAWCSYKEEEEDYKLWPANKSDRSWQSLTNPAKPHTSLKRCAVKIHKQLEMAAQLLSYT